MNCLGIEVKTRCKPELDEGFIPIYAFNRAFLRTAEKPFGVALTRNDGQVAVCNTFVHGTPEMRAADIYYVDRVIKTMLWMKGGYRISICGDVHLCNAIKAAYSEQGTRVFDFGFMTRVYEQPFVVERVSVLPRDHSVSQSVGKHFKGCRIGFDAGGSDRKVSAVVDGTPVFSEETVWYPKLSADPEYHFEGILESLKAAASRLPRVDAIGISSAGIFIGNRTMVSSLFLKVEEEAFNRKVKDIFARAAKAIADVPVVVCNDGDVAALAGSISLEKSGVLGIAMGTSEAAGFVDERGNITGWLNELAFVPVDVSPAAMRDEWSGDIGCGVKYFSQDAVIKLAPKAGIVLDQVLSPAEKLRRVQELMESGSVQAAKVFASIGVYLAYTLAYYYSLYSFQSVLLLGRVMSGRGGDLILETAKTVLDDEYPEIADHIRLLLPDEKARRVGQSVAAASLAE